MHPQYIIVGQGIAGTLISYALWKQKRSFLVFDEPQLHPRASVVAGAVINPVNVNKWTYAEEQQHFIATALRTYRSMEELLGLSFLEETSLLVFHQSETEQHQFNTHQLSIPAFIQQPSPAESVLAGQFFQDRFGVGKVAPVWRLKSTLLLDTWCQFLKKQGWFRREHFDVTDYSVQPAGIHYKGIRAEKIIFCEGATAVLNPYFRQLPFTRNRGDALLLSIPGLPATHIYQNGIRLVPVEKGMFWCGSNYRWQYDNLLPDWDWRRQTEATLKDWLRFPFKVEDHMVAERPTTAGQQFLTGPLASTPSVVIFNGLGTKGFSCGPALAQDLCHRLAATDDPGLYNRLQND